jgi:hypothetical protein
MGKFIRWDNENPFPEGTQDFVDDAAKAIRLRSKAAELEAEAKALKAEANDLAKVVLPILGEKVMSNLGGLTLFESTRSTTNNDGVKDYLVKKGVDPRTVSAAWRNNTTVKTSQSVRFIKPKS